MIRINTRFLSIMVMVGFLLGYTTGHVPSASPLKGGSMITQADFGTLAEAMSHGCEPEQERIEETIRDFCTKKHPLTKGNTNVH